MGEAQGIQEMNTNHVIKLMLPINAARASVASGESILRVVPAPGLEFEPVNKLHVTLAFLGKMISDHVRYDVLRACCEVAEHLGPIEATLGALARFRQHNRDVVYRTVDAPALFALRNELIFQLHRQDIRPDDTFTKNGWTPHVTIARVPHDAPVSIGEGDVKTVFRRLTYKAGAFDVHHWALTAGMRGVPLTDDHEMDCGQLIGGVCTCQVKV
jgi:2'-5' RNA ligase